MKKFTAIYREQRNAPMKDMVREYKTKALFMEDLKGSGFRVVAILTDKNIKEYQQMSEVEAIYKRGNAENIREYCKQVL